MKPTSTLRFGWNDRELVEEGPSPSIEHLIPLVDEVDHPMTLTCRYCGATVGPFLVIEDGGDYVVPLGTVLHTQGCPLVLAGRTH